MENHSDDENYSGDNVVTLHLSPEGFVELADLIRQTQEREAARENA